MKRILKERDRLLRLTARGIGVLADVAALICLLLPGAVPASGVLPSVVALVVLGFCHWHLGRTGGWIWITTTVIVGYLAYAVVAIGSAGGPTGAVTTVLLIIGGGGIASVAVILVSGRKRVPALIAVFLGTVAEMALLPPAADSLQFGTLLLGYSALGMLGFWLSLSVPRVMLRIESIGLAHRVERQASETEAQRRQGARLLHDTVLATLTLLAHSGVGVSTDALRQQASEDAHLLRQLRLGASPSPVASGSYRLTTVQEQPAGHTLESVKGRFGRMGLDVAWHGTGQILLDGRVLDSFLLALAECLENVRRHSGVNTADVTITDDETTVRAMVTDAGVGFDIRGVAPAKLGFKESVVARLSDVGGNARLFSSPGAGTTVVLEVPK